MLGSACEIWKFSKFTWPQDSVRDSILDCREAHCSLAETCGGSGVGGKILEILGVVGMIPEVGLGFMGCEPNCSWLLSSWELVPDFMGREEVGVRVTGETVELDF